MEMTQWSRRRLVSELISTEYRPQSHKPQIKAPVNLTPDGIVIRKLAVARELLLRDLAASLATGPVFSMPKEVRDWLRLHFANVEHEVFVILYLDGRHRLIDAVPMFRGTLTQTSVYPREVVKSALARNAAAVILAHNHPSGNADPSRADEMLTDTLKAALALVDIRVVDHMVVGGANIVSFAENGKI